ncbi:MAG: ATP-binding protein [bacterium]|nr:ATP-binding protein [bacterium]
MTKEEILKIVPQGESLTVEFKGEKKSPLSDHELYKAVVCLANGNGGLLLVGVEDDGRVTGARSRHGNLTDPLRLKAAIFNNTVPNLHVGVETFTINELDIIAIKVTRSDRPVSTASGLYIRRVIMGTGKPGCVPFYAHEMDSRRGSLGLFDLTAQPIMSVRWEDLDPIEFERLRRIVKQYRGDKTLLDLDNFEMAKALGLVVGDTEPEHPTLAGILLLGNEEILQRNVPAHEVAFQILKGTKVEVNNFFHWPLIRIVEEIMTQFGARNREEEIMIGLFRTGVPDYSEQGVREAFLNALIHRDYQKLGAVHFQWYEDIIEISNPGGFVEGVTLNNLLVTPPKPRNPRLADVFKRIGLVERTGRGIDTIFEGQVRYGRPIPDYGRTTESNVVVVLQGCPANLDFCKWVVEKERAGRTLSVDNLIILNELQHERRIDITHAMKLTQKTEGDVRATLEHLIEDGVIEAKGEKRGRIYHLSASVYKVFGKKAGYIRTRGFEPIQQEQMVIQYIEAHGRITRKEIVDLCKITSRQATHLLKKLVDKEILVLKGERKGAYYEQKHK